MNSPKPNGCVSATNRLLRRGPLTTNLWCPHCGAVTLGDLLQHDTDLNGGDPLYTYLDHIRGKIVHGSLDKIEKFCFTPPPKHTD